MPRFDASNAECQVTVYCEGMLAAVGHDLKLQVTDFSIEVEDESSIVAQFRSNSLRVLGALKQGKVDPQTISEKDRREIEHTTSTTVLNSKMYPHLRFRSTTIESIKGRYRVQGRLEMNGVVRALQFEIERKDQRAIARIPLLQTEYRITPFRALMGALRVKPEVLVEISVPWPAD